MEKAILPGILTILLAVSVSAQTCFTAVDVDDISMEYWKGIIYRDIKNQEYNNFLIEPTAITSIDDGAGERTEVVINKDCFSGHLLGPTYTDGASSSQISVKKRSDAIYSDNLMTGKSYIVSEGTKAFGNKEDYLSLPGTFGGDYEDHKEIYMATKEICDQKLDSDETMELIKIALWNRLEPAESLSCSRVNIVDCVWEQKKGNDLHYATTAMVMARMCKIPARVVYGISEGYFDGVDIFFDESKKHYWVEYYDNGWQRIETMESGDNLPEFIEYNCYDGLDNDGNALTDCFDYQCSESYGCTGWPTTDEFDNEYSTDLDKLASPIGVNKLTLGNEYGSVTWSNQNLNIREYDLDGVAEITQDYVKIDIIDKPAVIVFAKVMQNPVIYKDGSVCNSCSKIESSGNTQYEVPGIGKYSMQIGNTTQIDPEPVLFADQKNIVEKYWNKVKSIYNGMSDMTRKILAGLIVVGLIWIYFKRRRRNVYGPNR